MQNLCMVKSKTIKLNSKRSSDFGTYSILVIVNINNSTSVASPTKL